MPIKKIMITKSQKHDLDVNKDRKEWRISVYHEEDKDIDIKFKDTSELSEIIEDLVVDELSFTFEAE